MTGKSRTILKISSSLCLELFSVSLIPLKCNKQIQDQKNSSGMWIWAPWVWRLAWLRDSLSHDVYRLLAVMRFCWVIIFLFSGQVILSLLWSIFVLCQVYGLCGNYNSAFAKFCTINSVFFNSPRTGLAYWTSCLLRLLFLQGNSKQMETSLLLLTTPNSHSSHGVPM